MKILFLTPYVAWPLDHGGRIRTYHLLHALAQTHEVFNVAVARTPRDRDDAQALERIGIRVTPGLIREHDMRPPARRLAKWISVTLGRSSLPGRWWSRDFAALVRQSISGTRFDLAVVDSIWMDVYRPALGGIPFVASTQNIESDILLDVAGRQSGARRVIGERDARLLLRREAGFFSAATAAVAVSAEDAARMRSVVPAARVSVVENGIDTERLRPLPAPSMDSPLLFVGSFDYSANVDAAEFLVKDVMPALREKFGPVGATIAGRNPPPRVQAFGSLPGIEVTGTVEDLVPLYARASAVVVPIRVGGGSRLKILEALALARPVVTTTAGMRGLEVRDGVHVLVADTPAGFAAALERLRSDPGLAAKLAEAGRRFVETFHRWPALERKFADLVGDL